MSELSADELRDFAEAMGIHPEDDRVWCLDVAEAKTREEVDEGSSVGDRPQVSFALMTSWRADVDDQENAANFERFRSQVRELHAFIDIRTCSNPQSTDPWSAALLMLHASRDTALQWVQQYEQPGVIYCGTETEWTIAWIRGDGTIADRITRFHPSQLAALYSRMTGVAVNFVMAFATSAVEGCVDPIYVRGVERDIRRLASEAVSWEPSHIRKVVDRVVPPDPYRSALTGVPAGFRELDELTSGWQAGELIVVAARPAIGKTSFAVDMLLHATREHQTGGALFSLGADQAEIAERMLSSMARVPVVRTMRQKLDSDERGRLSRAAQLLRELPIFLDDTLNLSVDEICRRTRRLKLSTTSASSS